MSIRTTLTLALTALLAAGCATYPTEPPAIYQQDAGPPPYGMLTEGGPTIVYESPITETERGAWVRENVVPQSYTPPLQQVQVVRVIERPVYYEYERPYRYVSPVHLNVGYGWGHHGHRGWHTGLGWSFPLIW